MKAANGLTPAWIASGGKAIRGGNSTKPDMDGFESHWASNGAYERVGQSTGFKISRKRVQASHPQKGENPNWPLFNRLGELMYLILIGSLFHIVEYPTLGTVLIVLGCLKILFSVVFEIVKAIAKSKG
jgi:hypothetical protein